MCVQSMRCLKSKYLLFFSARWVSRHAGIDVRGKNLKSVSPRVFNDDIHVQLEFHEDRTELELGMESKVL